GSALPAQCEGAGAVPPGVAVARLRPTAGAGAGLGAARPALGPPRAWGRVAAAVRVHARADALGLGPAVFLPAGGPRGVRGAVPASGRAVAAARAVPRAQYLPRGPARPRHPGDAGRPAPSGAPAAPLG